MGVAQLEQLPGFLAAKRRIAARYDEALGAVAGITLPPRARWAEPSLWLYSIGIDARALGRDRRRMVDDLAAAGIQARPIWSPLHTMPMYREQPRLGGAVAEDLFEAGLSLPCSVSLTPAQQDAVVRAIRGR